MVGNGGIQSEDQVEAICLETYLADFVVRSPKFRQPSGKELEAADLILLFDETLVVLQVKSRQLPADFDPEDEAQVGRIRRRIEHGVEQVKTVRRALNSDSFTTLRNLRGVELPLDASRVRRVIGLVIADLVPDPSRGGEVELEVFGGLTAVADIPVHVFLLDDFRSLAEEVDTVPDLLRYLDTRAQLMERRIVFPLTCERDLLAMFLTDWPTVEAALDGDVTLLVVESGLWDAVRAERTKEFRARAERRRRSRILVDGMIAELHTSIGYKPAVEGVGEFGGDPFELQEGTVESYREIAFELARLARAERMVFAEKIWEKLTRADDDPKGFSYFVFRNPSANTVFAFVGSRENHDTLSKRVYTLASAAYVHFGRRRVVGIGTQNAAAKTRCHVFTLLENVSFPDEERLAEFARNTLGPQEDVGADEWGNTKKRQA